MNLLNCYAIPGTTSTIARKCYVTQTVFVEQDRLDYPAKLMTDFDIVFLQEHWYMEADLQQIARYVDKVCVIGISGMKVDSSLADHIVKIAGRGSFRIVKIGALGDDRLFR